MRKKRQNLSLRAQLAQGSSRQSAIVFDARVEKQTNEGERRNLPLFTASRGEGDR